MKTPKYLHIEWESMPTEQDKVGCDGLYLTSVRVDWWGWPLLIASSLITRILDKLDNKF